MKWLLVLSLVLVGLAYARAEYEDDEPPNEGDQEYEGDGNYESGNEGNGGVNNAEKIKLGERVCKMTPEIQEMIVRVHNEYRNKCALGSFGKSLPPAACMNKLDWSDKVAEAAQAHANNKLFDHDKSKDRFYMNGKKKIMMGQNLCLANVEENPKWEESLRKMYDDELPMLKEANVVDPFRYNMAYGHISQCFWARTAHIGCGISLIPDCNNCGAPGPVCMLTCNFNIPGNMQFEKIPMYEKTKRGENAGDGCSDGTDSEYPGLCNTPSYEVDPNDKGRCKS